MTAKSGSLSELALSHALRELQAERGSLMFVDADRNELRIRAARGLTPQVVKHTRVPMGRGLAGRVAHTGQATTVGRGESVSSRRMLARPNLGRSFVVPVYAQDEVIGVLNASQGHPAEGKHGDEALERLRVLTSEIAPCLAYDWLSAGGSSALSEGTLRWLGSGEVLEQALRSAARFALDWARADLVLVMLAEARTGAPAGAVMARQSTAGTVDLAREVRQRVESLIANGRGQPVHADVIHTPEAPAPLRLPQLAAAHPVVCEADRCGWLCAYSLSNNRSDGGRDTAAAFVAQLCSSLVLQNALCRRFGGATGETAQDAVDRAVFEALITTVCHEVNNPAGGILGMAQLLKLRDDLPDDVRTRLDDIEHGALRLGQFTRQLARLRSAPQPDLVDFSGTKMIALGEP